jgi:thiol-disulfide isomerase/thioredoxin
MSQGDVGRRRFVRTATLALAGARLGVLGAGAKLTACAAVSHRGALPSFDGATAWINSPPLTADALRGQVVLIDFWTYTCINWLRTVPYVRAWSERYKGKGLVVIGVHSPEFAFERDVENVRRAATAMNLPYPIAVDSDHAIWRAFHNEYWPALYFADALGEVVHHHFGEGSYESSEKRLQGMLHDGGYVGVVETPVTVAPRGIEADASWSDLQSIETYIGVDRTERFASPGGLVRDARHSYAAPAQLTLNRWGLSGDWKVGGQAAVLQAPNGGISYRFHARDLHLVMGPTVRGAPVRFRVSLDGRPPGVAHGLDVDGQGNGVATEQRLYQLIRQPPPIADRSFEITFLDAGMEAYAFTFG